MSTALASPIPHSTIHRPSFSSSHSLSHHPPFPLAELQRSRSQADPEDPTDYPRTPSPRGYEAPALPTGEEVTFGRLITHYATMVPMAMLGTLARIGLVALGSYDGRVIFPLAWAQGVGCAIMGTVLVKKSDLSLLYPPLYTALTTGLAGSITTFSSWMLEGYAAFANLGGYQRGGLRDTMDGIAYSIATGCIAIASVRFGEHCSRSIPWVPKLHHLQPSKEHSDSSLDTPPHTKQRRLPNPIIDSLVILLAVLFYIGAGLLYAYGPNRWRHDISLPLLFAPPGAAIRLALSKLNQKTTFIDRFPIGTFLVNIIGTAVIAGVYSAQRSKALTLNGNTCNVLYAIEEGFCGCLTTVSTFIVEAGSIRGNMWKWTYMGTSVVLGQVVVMAVVGGTSWSVGLQGSCA